MIELLMARGKMKISELAEELEVDERMIRFYRDELEKAQVFVDSERGPHGGYYIERKHLFPVLNFTAEELESIEMAVNSVFAKKHDQHLEKLQYALDKVRAAHQHWENRQRHIYFTNSFLVNSEMAANESYRYTTLYEAFAKRNKAKITYKAASSNQQTERVIQPYAFVYYDEFLYCVGWCELREELRNFKLVRIEQVEILPDNYMIPRSFDIRNELPQLGLIKDSFFVELHIQSPYSYTVKESVWGEHQHITEQHDGSILFRAEMNGKESVKKWIFGMGVNVEVIHPQWLRDELKETMQKIVEKYDKK